ncbi:MAG: STAS domain-containing protein [Cyanobacteria bacterium]|jgi:anti-sigma B factor antagonist|nr:STAS domain-containing protein [Cyanobacteriota bacterium]
MTTRMSIEATLNTWEKGTRTIVEIDTQNVDFRNCEGIKSAIGNIVNSGKKDIVLNLNKVTFMDSSGLSVILHGKRSCEEVGGTFSVCSLQSYVNNLFNLTSLHKAIKIHPDESDIT